MTDDAIFNLTDSPWERLLRDAADSLIAMTGGDYEACRLLVSEQQRRMDEEVLLRIQSRLGQG